MAVDNRSGDVRHTSNMLAHSVSRLLGSCVILEQAVRILIPGVRNLGESLFKKHQRDRCQFLVEAIDADMEILEFDASRQLGDP